MSSLADYLRIFRPIALVAVATFILIGGDLTFSFGGFTVYSTLSMVGLAIVLTVIAWCAYMLLAVVICLPLKIQYPGVLLATALGVLAGSISLYLVSLLFPATAHLANIVLTVPYSFANTLLVWLIAYFSNSLKPGLTLYPIKYETPRT